MKKITLTLVVLSVFMVPAVLMAQPPRPHSSRVPQGRPQPAHHMYAPQHGPAYHAPMHHVAPRHRPPHNMSVQYIAPHHRPPMYRPPVVHPPVVIVPQPVTPHYYYPAGNGVSVTIGGRHGAVSIYRGL